MTARVPTDAPLDAGVEGTRRADRTHWLSATPFLALQLTPLLVLVTGFTARAVVLMLVTFWVRQFCITGGYHRYFAHRTYRLARIPQFLLAFGGTTAAQKGPLWWAGHHRTHHRFADRDGDVHSPLLGFWWSHVGWILSDRYARTDVDQIGDFARYPELRFLDRFDWIGPWALALFCWWWAGWPGLVLGFFCSTVLLWHSTFAVNSVAHVLGRRAYATQDTSRNSALLAVLTLGEGWHNNHHYFPSSARNGFRWWQWDPTFYVIRVAAWLRIARDVRRVPPHLLRRNRVRDGAFDIGLFRAGWTRATRTLAAVAGPPRTDGPELAADLTDLADVADVADELSGLDSRRAGLVTAIAARRQALDDLLRAGLLTAEQLAQAGRELERRQAASARGPAAASG